MSLQLRNQKFTSELEPSIGGSVSRFALLQGGSEIELLRRAKGKTVLNMSMFPMLPYCGRIRDNQFQVGEKIYHLKPNFGTEPLACHGDGWINPWNVEDVNDTRAVLSLELENAPYIFKAWQTFELSEEGLSASLRIQNKADEKMPFGLGFHPYFDKTQATLQMKSKWVWLEGPLFLPTEYVSTPPELSFDVTKRLPEVWRNMCYSGWAGIARIRFEEVLLEIASTGSHIQLYTPASQLLLFRTTVALRECL